MTWQEFSTRCLSVSSHAELREFIDREMPPQDTEERRWFTSLMFFLEALRRPGRASDLEWAFYRVLTRRMVDEGIWSPKAYQEAFGDD